MRPAAAPAPRRRARAYGPARRAAGSKRAQSPRSTRGCRARRAAQTRSPKRAPSPESRAMSRGRRTASEAARRAQQSRRRGRSGPGCSACARSALHSAARSSSRAAPGRYGRSVRSGSASGRARVSAPSTPRLRSRRGPEYASSSTGAVRDTRPRRLRSGSGPGCGAAPGEGVQRRSRWAKAGRRARSAASRWACLRVGSFRACRASARRVRSLG